MDLTRWLGVAVDAAREIAHAALGVAESGFDESAGEPAGDLYGVYIPLVGEGVSLQLGMLADRRVCAALARALIGMAPGEQLESDADVLDAMGEVSNLIAGAMKMRVAAEMPLVVGLPLALCGRVFPAAGSQSRLGVLRFDEHELWLTLAGTTGRRR